MKKLMMALAVVAFGLSAHAMAVSWKYNAAKDSTMNGVDVYLVLGDTAKTDWASASAVAAEAAKLEVNEGSVAHGTIGKKGTSYSASGEANSPLIASKTQNYYYVLVDSAEENFKVSSVIPGTGIYDPTAQESATQQVVGSDIFAGAWTKFAGTPVPGPDPAPEPTSGLLLLLGMAGMALRRKQK